MKSLENIMLSNEILDSEVLYRAVKKSNPDSFINNKPTPALFLDENGVSVVRDAKRSESSIIKEIKEEYIRDDYERSVKISARICREVGTCPKAIHNIKKKTHAEIHESENIVEISLPKAVLLSRLCTKVEQ